MEKFKVTLKQKSFSATAENINANNLLDLSNNIAAFCKETVNLHNKLAGKKVLNQNTRIKVGQSMEINIVYLEDDFSLCVNLRNFGRFVIENETETVSEAIYSIADYQQKVGYLFNVAK